VTLNCDCGATLCEICGGDINLKESTRANIAATRGLKPLALAREIQPVQEVTI